MWQNLAIKLALTQTRALDRRRPAAFKAAMLWYTVEKGGLEQAGMDSSTPPGIAVRPHLSCDITMNPGSAPRPL